MQEVFQINPSVSLSDLQDTLNDFIIKTKALNNLVLMCCFDEAGNLTAAEELLFHSLWTISGLLDEIEKLQSAVMKALN